jgi:hypothetical protein
MIETSRSISVDELLQASLKWNPGIRPDPGPPWIYRQMWQQYVNVLDRPQIINFLRSSLEMKQVQLQAQLNLTAKAIESINESLEEKQETPAFERAEEILAEGLTFDWWRIGDPAPPWVWTASELGKVLGREQTVSVVRATLETYHAGLAAQIAANTKAIQVVNSLVVK